MSNGYDGKIVQSDAPELWRPTFVPHYLGHDLIGCFYCREWRHHDPKHHRI